MLRHCSGSSHQSIAAAPLPATMASTTFSLFFPVPKAQWPAAAADEAAAAAFDDDHSSITTSPSSPSSSSSAGSVDCTLSLGTPSSRRATAEPTKRAAQPPAYPSVSAASAVSWDVAADQSYYCCQGSKKPTAVTACAANKGTVARTDHDALLMDRRCANCGTSSTPLWRNGPRGPKSLCNACGIRFKKEERRAVATAMDQQSACGYVAPRAHYGPATGKQAPGAVPYCGEGAFPCGGGDVADAEAPFLTWRLNVVAPAPAPAFAVWPEQTTLFQYN
ncbi:hypothetical protein BAE44_0021776 [Dichanthelium oligosanthes]|uniref:GATA-type domain-containing protein n=1 Tax=Dichanthelium oligosanthes TaxID=888268 RepID=A0A1E5UWM6_9POAL|nr:hypothetical protein BAE44_0021776 [Dichanthelium oligosanthes]